MKRILFALTVALALIGVSCTNPANSDSPKPEFALTYNGNDNTAGSAPTATSYTEGATVTVLGNTNALTKNSYNFAGWNTLANGTGTSYVVGSTFAMPAADVTLYAQWTVASTYAVTYSAPDATGGTIPTDGTVYPAGSSAVVLVGEPARTDYLFLGWTLNSDGSGTLYKAGGYITVDSVNVTLYAKWSPKHFEGRSYGKPYYSNETPDETLYNFSITGYGNKESGQFVIVKASGQTLTGTYTLKTDYTNSTSGSGEYAYKNVKYDYLFTNSYSCTISFTFATVKSSGATIVFGYLSSGAVTGGIDIDGRVDFMPLTVY